MDLHTDDGDLATLVDDLMSMGYTESEAVRLALDILENEKNEF